MAGELGTVVGENSGPRSNDLDILVRWRVPAADRNRLCVVDAWTEAWGFVSVW
jgi:hypothetical protein